MRTFTTRQIRFILFFAPENVVTVIQPDESEKVNVNTLFIRYPYRIKRGSFRYMILIKESDTLAEY
jgi:hypothetical protein